MKHDSSTPEYWMQKRKQLFFCAKVLATVCVLATGFFDSYLRPDPVFELLNATGTATVIFCLWLSEERQK